MKNLIKKARKLNFYRRSVNSLKDHYNYQVLISFFIIIVGLLSTWFLCKQGYGLGLKIQDIVTNVIQIWICVASFVSVTFIIASYIHTNNAFLISQKPYLLLQVINGNMNNNHVTIIRYHNPSSNPFYDLSLFVKVYTSDQTIDLGYLFLSKMYMASYDERTRNFFTFETLTKHDFDIDHVISQKQEIILSLSYGFTFNNEKITIHVQEYK